MQFTKIAFGLILTGAMGVLVASWRSDFSDPSLAQHATRATNASLAAAASVEPAQALTFELLAQTGFKDINTPPDFPKALQELEGKRVCITGFVAPYNDPNKMTKLLLLQSPTGCFFCNPPEINAVVFVRRVPGDSALSLDNEPVKIEGTLLLWKMDLPKTNETRHFLFTLDRATVLGDR